MHNARKRFKNYIHAKWLVYTLTLNLCYIYIYNSIRRVYEFSSLYSILISKP
jgi:hypothetical protein